MSPTVCYVYLALQIICIILSSVFQFMTVYYSTVNAVSVIHVHSWLACELWLDVAKRVPTHPHTHTSTQPWVCIVQYDVRKEHSQPGLPTVMMQWWTLTSSELSVFCRCRGVRITCPSPHTQLQEWCCLQTDIHSSFPMWGLMMPVIISVHQPTELVAMIVTFI